MFCYFGAETGLLEQEVDTGFDLLLGTGFEELLLVGGNNSDLTSYRPCG